MILPFIVMRRLDCILEASKPAILAAEKGLPEGIDDETRDMILFGAAGHNIRVCNTSRFTFTSLKGQDPGQLHDNLIDYITRFSPNVREFFSTNSAPPNPSSDSKMEAFSGRCSSASAPSTCTRTKSQISKWANCSRI